MKKYIEFIMFEMHFGYKVKEADCDMDIYK